MSSPSAAAQRARALGAALLLLLPAACAQAAGSADDAMDRVDFQVERSAEVANDRAVAIVGVSDEDSDSARLSGRINAAMAWALERAKATEGVEAESAGYHTQPVYEKGKIRRWRGSQDLRLESADVAVLSELVGALQEKLLVRSISFHVSPEKRREAEDALIAEALAAFQARADRIAEGLGARGHALVQLSVGTGGAQPMPRVRAMGYSAAEAAPPALEGGRSTLSVRIHGTIELER